MKTNFIFILFIFSCSHLYSQVGINTENPKTTLDVVGVPATATVLDGIIPPRLSVNQLRSKTYTSAQIGAIVYVTAADTSPAGQTIRVTSEGHYTFSSDLLWTKIGSIAKSGMLIVKNDIVGIGNNTAGAGMTNISDFSVPLKAGETIQISINLLVVTTNSDWSISLDLPNYSSGEFLAGQATWCNTSAANGNGGNWWTWRFSPSTSGFPRGTIDTSLGSTANGVVRIELTYKASTAKNFDISFGNDIIFGGVNHTATVKAGSTMTYSVL